jgi:hypothetical protein
MQAIQVKFLPATNTRGTRVKAITAAWTKTIPYSYDLDDFGNARKAATELLNLSGWASDGIEINGSGSLPCGDYVFTVGV